MVVSHVEIFNAASIELLWWLFVIPVLNIMWTLYNFWANLILSNVGSDVFFRSCDFFQKRKVAFFLSWRSRCCSKSQCRFASIFWKKQSPSLQWCFIYPTESFDVNDIVSAKFLSKINDSKPLGFLPWFLLISFFLQLPLSFNWNWWDPANLLSGNYSALDMIQFYCVNNNAVYKYFDVQKNK